MSEAHHRQMKLFAENGGKFVSGFSSEFLKGYLDILRRQFGGKRVHSNVVYQEYIKDKEHIHMNATRWHTLTGLCMWLGKQGICKVDETEKGWYVEYIDRDPEKIKKQEVNERLEKTEDEYNRQFLRKFFSQSLTLVERQIEFNLSRTETEEGPNYAPLVRPDESQPIRLNMSLVPKKVDPEGSSLLTETQTTTTTVADSTDKQPMKLLTLATKKPKPVNPLLEAEKKAREEKGKCASEKPRTDDRSGVAGSRRRALDELMQKEEASKDKRNRRDYWMTEGLEVKLVNKKLPDNIRLRHGAVVKMLDNYTAIVRVLNDGTKIKVDQEHVQTVIPPVSSTVLLVNGAYRGEYATLESVDKELCLCEVTIATGLCMGRLIKHVSLDDVCKLAERRLD
ncbi:Zinc finger protein RTS2 [Fasciola hepatica]|uniref:Zinc finger protein RTS2 n=1 Tax=Fasciola hepatica TaxID=6192 RepID=A0A4E0RTN6_FASHE|nr:Zinc finger protein RTS2 [Fasciola hepatica]